MINKLKYIVIGIIFSITISFIVPTFANTNLQITKNPFPIYINNALTEIEAYNINNYTYIKLADILRLFGFNVFFNKTNNQIEISSISEIPSDITYNSKKYININNTNIEMYSNDSTSTKFNLKINDNITIIDTKNTSDCLFINNQLFIEQSIINNLNKENYHMNETVNFNNEIFITINKITYDTKYYEFVSKPNEHFGIIEVTIEAHKLPADKDIITALYFIDSITTNNGFSSIMSSCKECLICENQKITTTIKYAIPNTDSIKKIIVRNPNTTTNKAIINISN
jgi:predicted RNA binding protein with dsRBD fold (UPF0201 family)